MRRRDVWRVIVSVCLLAALHGSVNASSLWTQQQELTVNQPLALGTLSYPVALSGDAQTMLLGEDGAENGKGAAQVMWWDGFRWQQQELIPGVGPSGDRFGHAVALSRDGATALVGAPGGCCGGSAYVFVRNPSGWTLQQQLSPVDGAFGDDFGGSVALDSGGTTALIGADGQNSDAGAAYVFVRRGSSWAQEQEISPSDAAQTQSFGLAVALSNDGATALLGASDAMTSQGNAYVFTRTGAQWTQAQKLQAADGAPYDNFGASVALSGNGTTALLGAFDTETSVGAAYVFFHDGPTWKQQQKLAAGDSSGDSMFGNDVALNGDGNIALVGAFNQDAAGAGYVYHRLGAAWSQEAKLSAADGQMGDFFGASLALSDDGTTALIGADGRNGNRASAYLFGATPRPGIAVLIQQLNPETGLYLSTSSTPDGFITTGSLFFQDLRQATWPTDVYFHAVAFGRLTCTGPTQATIRGTGVFNGVTVAFTIFVDGNQSSPSGNPPNSYRLQTANYYDSGWISAPGIDVGGC